MPTLSRSPRHHAPHPQAGACRKESCVPPTGEAVFLWGQFEKEGRAAACGHCPQGPGITGTLPRMRLFTFPVPKPPQHTREEAGRDTETARGDMARERLGTSPLSHQTPCPKSDSHEALQAVPSKDLNSGKGNLGPSSPGLRGAWRHGAPLLNTGRVSQTPYLVELEEVPLEPLPRGVVSGPQEPPHLAQCAALCREREAA